MIANRLSTAVDHECSSPVGDAPRFGVPSVSSQNSLCLTIFDRQISHIRQKIGRMFSKECKITSECPQSALSMCQKSAGIDQLQVEKPGVGRAAGRGERGGEPREGSP